MSFRLTWPRGIRLMLTPPAGSRETIRQTTAQFVNSVHAQAGINAHFVLPFPSTDTADWQIGLAASDGRVFSACESPEQSFALVADLSASTHLNGPGGWKKQGGTSAR